MEIIEYDNKYRNAVIGLILYIENIENKIDLSLEEQPDLYDIEKFFPKSTSRFWIAIENNAVIGTIAFKKLCENGGVLKKFFVDKSYRGQKIGLKLYKTLLEFCKDNNIKNLILDTPRVAHKSHEFYKEAGFNVINKDKLPFEYSYPDRDSLLFFKEL